MPSHPLEQVLADKSLALSTRRDVKSAWLAFERWCSGCHDKAGLLDMERLRRIPGVHNARAQNGNLRVEALELHTVLPALLEELRRQAVEMTELRTRSATLEDVFMSLTGRHLRDD